MKDGLIRALAFHEAWGYAPTEVELIASWDAGKDKAVIRTWKEAQQSLAALIQEKKVLQLRGRIVFPGQEELVHEHERRERLFARKIRRAKRVTAWLARLGGVRFVALCNTTALAHAREEGDLDFFIITRSGSLWQTRGLAAFPFKLLGLRPGSHQTEERDAVCLSFFIDDTNPDLTSLQVPQDDPYFRHWFLSLLPLIDDGVGEELWRMNKNITQQHPLAEPWMLHPELSISPPWIRLPVVPPLEQTAQQAQTKVLPKTILDQANQSSNVVITEHVLKMHALDNRETFRQKYYSICRAHDVQP